jgi:hypothetical protein
MLPVNYTVKAAVVDLRGNTPKLADKFYVDTNVWFWTVYSNVQFSPQPASYHQTEEYPAYLKRVQNMGGQLHWCGLSLFELAHLIEKTEFKIYCTAKSASLNQKAYRHNLPDERARIIQEIEADWGVVKSMAACLTAPEINEASTTAALEDFAQLPVDGYDLFAIRALKAAGITQVISDDGDFCSVPGITLFTANQAVIAAAHTQGRLSRR